MAIGAQGSGNADDLRRRQVEIEEELTLFESYCQRTPGRKRGPATPDHGREKKQRLSVANTSSARPESKGKGRVIRIAGRKAKANPAPTEQTTPSEGDLFETTTICKTITVHAGRRRGQPPSKQRSRRIITSEETRAVKNKSA